ncbi:MAG: HlyC/CorC family transporter [Chthoniobacterales bacterium]|nr:HlyC/CorC family transporter [Chthoniobacterales bacterium]
MTILALAVAFTLGISFCCSLLEAMFLSTTTAEVEALKQRNPRRGQIFEDSRHHMEETISSILTLNTIANTLGAVIVGGIATKLFGEAALGVISAAMTLAILIFSEVVPKNLGVAYRATLQKHTAYPLYWMRRALRPLTHLCNLVVRAVIRTKPDGSASDQEIFLLAEKGAREGTLTGGERDLIHNALSLSTTRVADILTPRSVVVALDENLTASQVLAEHPSIRFSRMPVHEENVDNITGLARRRDILHCVASGQGERKLKELKQPVSFVPEMATAASALQTLLSANQQLATVVDEYGGFVGVVSIEDIVEHLIGREIYEKDDVAVDMRALARRRGRNRRGNPTPATP